MRCLFLYDVFIKLTNFFLYIWISLVITYIFLTGKLQRNISMFFSNAYMVLLFTSEISDLFGIYPNEWYKQWIFFIFS